MTMKEPKKYRQLGVRLPVEVAKQMSEYISTYNYFKQPWWERRMSQAILVSRAILEFLERHPIEEIKGVEVKGERPDDRV